MIECEEEETDAGGGEVESRGWKVGVESGRRCGGRWKEEGWEVKNGGWRDGKGGR